MLFSSMIFLWVFLPTVLAGYFLILKLPIRKCAVKRKTANLFLLAASLFFYAWGGIYYLLIMIFTIATDYLGGFAIKQWARTPRAKKAALVLTLFLNLAVLFFFKYFNMVVTVIESLVLYAREGGNLRAALFGMQGTGALGIAKIVLPAGISFFTFQAMSYVVDVYRGKAKLQKNILDFALYVALFPQLIAGPIVQYADVEKQFTDRRESPQEFVQGQKRFCYGLAKKVLIANTLAEVADSIWALETAKLGAAVAWLGLFAYTFQIYYDFSGYSDMAIGLGKMFGFRFKENFRYPYTALSVREFWQRWHISLSSWFKEYVYIPLGGNRGSKFCTCRNIFLVFLLTGIWHGANFTFIMWGLLYAALQILERLFLGKLLEKNPLKLLNWLYVILAVMIGWVYFRADNIFMANEYIRQMFTFGGYREYSALSYLSVKAVMAFALALLGMGVLQRALQNIYEKIQGRLPVLVLDNLLQIVMLAASIFMLVAGTYNPFIYFQF